MSMLDDPHLGASGLLDRGSERDVLERLVTGVRAGQSRVLVLRGEAGIGKTALLGYLSAAAEGCRIARIAGVESEMELAFAACMRCAHRPARSACSRTRSITSLRSTSIRGHSLPLRR